MMLWQSLFLLDTSNGVSDIFKKVLFLAEAVFVVTFRLTYMTMEQMDPSN